VERVLDIDVPGAAERLPGVVVQRSRQRAGPGVERQRARVVGVDELAGDGGIGRVGGDRGERVAMLGPQLLEPGTSRATPTTVAPASDSAVAMVRPKPRLAPVTTAVVPESSCNGI
jgi:hypothetical protein